MQLHSQRNEYLRKAWQICRYFNQKQLHIITCKTLFTLYNLEDKVDAKSCFCFSLLFRGISYKKFSFYFRYCFLHVFLFNFDKEYTKICHCRPREQIHTIHIRSYFFFKHTHGLLDFRASIFICCSLENHQIIYIGQQKRLTFINFGFRNIVHT